MRTPFSAHTDNLAHLSICYCILFVNICALILYAKIGKTDKAVFRRIPGKKCRMRCTKKVSVRCLKCAEDRNWLLRNLDFVHIYCVASAIASKLALLSASAYICQN